MKRIRVLYRRPDTMELWGIPYDMRPGQQPRDIWEGWRIPDTAKQAAGVLGATIGAPGAPGDWVWLGAPGWWGSLTAERREQIEAFLMEHHEEVPRGPGEWSRVGCTCKGRHIPSSFDDGCLKVCPVPGCGREVGDCPHPDGLPGYVDPWKGWKERNER